MTDAEILARVRLFRALVCSFFHLPRHLIMPASTPPKTYADYNALVAADALKLAADQASKGDHDAAYAAQARADADAIAADQSALASDTAARNAAFNATGKAVVHDNGDGSYTIYESDNAGGVVPKAGIADSAPLPPPS